MPSKVCDEITHPFPNFNGTAIEVWEWISNFITHYIMDVITYPWMGLQLIHVSKRVSSYSNYNQTHWESILILWPLQQHDGIKPIYLPLTILGKQWTLNFLTFPWPYTAIVMKLNYMVFLNKQKFQVLFALICLIFLCDGPPDVDSVHKNHRTCRTFPMARPKCLMRDFTNLNRIYKAHRTNVWWTIKFFRIHCVDKLIPHPSLPLLLQKN